MATQFDGLDGLIRKALLGFIKCDAETSETPEFAELRTRHYEASTGEVYDAALRVIERYIQWTITGREKNLGGIATIKCDIVSLVLGGNIDTFSVWMIEELLPSGSKSVSVNARSISNAGTKGDLGENRRHIGFFLEALDEEVSRK